MMFTYLIKLNICNDLTTQLNIVGIDYNNTILMTIENSIYDIKKNSKYASIEILII